MLMEHATFSWGVDEAPILRDITLRLPAAKLIAVVGPVGAGKSSLISAFLGEMDRSAGRVNISGSVAYVSQQAWIQNATLKDNILFGKPENQKLYKRVIDACALKQDLGILAAGDQTEIGEKVRINFYCFCWILKGITADKKLSNILCSSSFWTITPTLISLSNLGNKLQFF